MFVTKKTKEKEEREWIGWRGGGKEKEMSGRNVGNGLTDDEELGGVLSEREPMMRDITRRRMGKMCIERLKKI